MTLRNGSPTTLSNLAFELVDIELPPWKLNAESCLSPAWKPEPPHGLSSLPRMTSEKSKPFHSSGGEIVKSLSYSGSFSLSNEAFKVVLVLLRINPKPEATVRGIRPGDRTEVTVHENRPKKNCVGKCNRAWTSNFFFLTLTSRARNSNELISFIKNKNSSKKWANEEFDSFTLFERFDHCYFTPSTVSLSPARQDKLVLTR